MNVIKYVLLDLSLKIIGKIVKKIAKTFFGLFSLLIFTGAFLQCTASYKSQYGQDKFLNEHVFKNKKNGVFIDIGAHDGVTYSNTYYFEKELGWTGICIEPHPVVFSQLLKNRKARCYPVCIAKENGLIEFTKIEGPEKKIIGVSDHIEMLSGITTKYDVRHSDRIENELASYGGKKEIITVPARTLTSVLEESKVTTIDLLSIDVEGAELDVLLSIDFNRFKIQCILVENNYPDTFKEVKDLLLRTGYRHDASIHIDEVFILKSANELSQ